jgi:hypothetical protein
VVFVSWPWPPGLGGLVYSNKTQSTFQHLTGRNHVFALKSQIISFKSAALLIQALLQNITNYTMNLGGEKSGRLYGCGSAKFDLCLSQLQLATRLEIVYILSLCSLHVRMSQDLSM